MTLLIWFILISSFLWLISVKWTNNEEWKRNRKFILSFLHFASDDFTLSPTTIVWEEQKNKKYVKWNVWNVILREWRKILSRELECEKALEAQEIRLKLKVCSLSWWEKRFSIRKQLSRELYEWWWWWIEKIKLVEGGNVGGASECISAFLTHFRSLIKITIQMIHSTTFSPCINAGNFKSHWFLIFFQTQRQQRKRIKKRNFNFHLAYIAFIA
jgi:hypothetical protein